MSYLDGLKHWRDAKVIEPRKRNKDGLRWIVHRFPIRGGISMRDAMGRDLLTASNSFIERLKIKWEK